MAKRKADHNFSPKKEAFTCCLAYAKQTCESSQITRLISSRPRIVSITDVGLLLWS